MASGGGGGGCCASDRGAPLSTAAVRNRISDVYPWMWITVTCVAFSVSVFVFRLHGPPAAFVSDHPCGGTLPEEQKRVGAAAGDRLLDGLLAEVKTDAESCLGRREAGLYRKASPWKPSSHLVRRLRAYEVLHRRCAPTTASFNKTLTLLHSPGLAGTAPPAPGACKYVVVSPRDGLGNRMLSLASSFLYALLAGRVLLVERANGLADLFCEPFPGATWMLPPEFPVRRWYAFGKDYPGRYGSLTRKRNNTAGGIPGFIYIHLAHDYGDDDKAFFCDAGEQGSLLRETPWLIMRSNQYFAPALFRNPAFEHELRRLFPEKEAVFHHLGRYLFHPSNAVWGLVTRYYRAYLAAADEKIGIQIRLLGGDAAAHSEAVVRQILRCALKEKLLPEVKTRNESNLQVAGGAGGDNVTGGRYGRPPLKAVLVTSLSSGYSERLKDMYWEHLASGGGVDVSVHQPSHEEWQQTGTAAHDAKALAEITLLSLCDTLVTTAWSTFGYVAQGLAGRRPWILLMLGKGKASDPACVRAMSPEPCFHFPPGGGGGGGGGKAGRREDVGGAAVPYLKRCEDTDRGLKLVAAGPLH